LLSTDGPETTVIDGGEEGRVVTFDSEYSPSEPKMITDATQFIGFTIQNGNLAEGKGAGIYVFGAEPTFTNLIIQNNTINGNGYGGGAYLTDFDGTVSNCQYINNKVSGDTYAEVLEVVGYYLLGIILKLQTPQFKIIKQKMELVSLLKTP